MLAACDKELLGKTLEDSERGIEVHLSEKFYGGQSINEGELQDMLASATIINLFGDKCISAAKTSGCIDKECVIFIAGIPHAIMASL